MKRKQKNKTKNEHYVPKCYLKSWQNDKGHVVVYDKESNKIWENNISDVACERYYYDIDYKKLSAQKIDMLKKLGIDAEEDEQFIEHFLSGQVESVYSTLLAKIIDREITPWHEKNCYFITPKDKLDFALCLAFQYIRTNKTRQMILDANNCLGQAFKDMNASEEMTSNYILDEGEEKSIQGNMILDVDNILELTLSFCRLTWILGVNRTTNAFYTSDNPIGTREHVKHPFMSMAGIRSKGVEVYIPLSPSYILLMYDGAYHTDLMSYDRRYVSLTETEDIELYNKLCAYNSNRFVFSKDGEYRLIEQIVEKDPKAFHFPTMTLSWGGKEYVPR